MALFQSAGILPCCKEAEKRRNKLGVSTSAINLRYLEGKPSGPAAFDGSRDFNTLLMPTQCNSMGGIFGKGESPMYGKSSL